MVAYIEGTEYDERENEDSEQFMSDSDDSMIDSEGEGEGEGGREKRKYSNKRHWIKCNERRGGYV